MDEYDEDTEREPQLRRLAQAWHERRLAALNRPGLCDGLYHVILPNGKVRGQFLVLDGSVIACDPPDLREHFHIHVWHSHRVDPALPWEAPPKT